MAILPPKINHFQVEYDLYSVFEAHLLKKLKMLVPKYLKE